MRRWYPATDVDLRASGVPKQYIDFLRDAGLEVCQPRNECDAHPGEPEACYLCL